jgi:hypothetical protein
MNINLHIERLVLAGLDLSQRQRAELGAALAGELERLLAAGGLSPALAKGLAVPRLDVGSIQLTPGGDAGQMGVSIARSIYQGALAAPASEV